MFLGFDILKKVGFWAPPYSGSESCSLREKGVELKILEKLEFFLKLDEKLLHPRGWFSRWWPWSNAVNYEHLLLGTNFGVSWKQAILFRTVLLRPRPFFPNKKTSTLKTAISRQKKVENQPVESI